MLGQDLLLRQSGMSFNGSERSALSLTSYQ
ncbi:MAG: hypothetical protein JWM21_251 [Acidobacteria bacterium]|nr:hypothetical protein [Acidobacteriota bacterium]